MSDTESAAGALMELAKNSEGRKKTARLRELLPEIEAAVEAGVTQNKILEVLNQQGLDMTRSSYSVMLSRARKQRDKKLESGKRVSDVKVVGAAKTDFGKPPSSTEIKPGEPKTLDWDVEKNNKTDHWK